MDIRRALKGQYHAALAMLREVIEKCPDELWWSGPEERIFSGVIYHTMFYAHFYMLQNESALELWSRHKVGTMHYTKEEILEYWGICDEMVDSVIDSLDLDTDDCGFPWYSMPKLDHELMNIRHIQHHTGQLGQWLMDQGVDVSWIGGK